MAETYPPGVSTFTLIGRLVRGVADTGDAGQEPDVIPVTDATITINAELDPPIFRVPGATPPVTIYQETINGETDANGWIKVVGVTEPGIVLAWGGDPDINPSGWSWRVRVQVGTFPSQDFIVAGSDGGTVDLALLSPA